MAMRTTQELKQWQERHSDPVSHLLQIDNAEMAESALVHLWLNVQVVQCVEVQEEEDFFHTLTDLITFIEESRCVLRVYMAAPTTHAPNLTLGALAWVTCSRLKLLRLETFQLRSDLTQSSWWLHGTDNDSSLKDCLLIPYAKPICKMTVSEVTCSAHCLLEPLRGICAVLKILSSYAYTDSPSHTYVACLELRLAELALGHEVSGSTVKQDAYDCEIYCAGGIISQRSYGLGVALNNLLHDKDVLHSQYNVKVLQHANPDTEILANNCVSWIEKESNKWSNEETDSKQREFLQRRLCLPSAEMEAIARVGIINPTDKLYVLRCSRQHCANSLLSIPVEELKKSFQCADHWSMLFKANLCFTNQVGDGILSLYGVFLWPHECMLSGWIPQHSYPYICEGAIVPEMIFVKPQQNGKPIAYLIPSLQLALLLWIKYIIAHHDGTIWINAKCYNVHRLYELWTE